MPSGYAAKTTQHRRPNHTAASQLPQRRPHVATDQYRRDGPQDLSTAGIRQLVQRILDPDRQVHSVRLRTPLCS